ncbi:MAG: hypothetical protein JSR56_01360 [Proteobacteria bacterium]|nr:hypothetical protein [Pseudomonadota bacterium]
MNLAIHLPYDRRARSGVTLYTTPEALRIDMGRCTLRRIGLDNRLREAAFAPASVSHPSFDTT